MKIARYSEREQRALSKLEDLMIKEAPPVSVIQKQRQTAKSGLSEDFKRLKRLCDAALKGQGPGQARDILERLKSAGIKDVKFLSVSKALWALCEDGLAEYRREEHMNGGGGGALFTSRVGGREREDDKLS